MILYKITTKAVFPEGVAPGAGMSSNRQILARNGKGQTLLRGTALAGILRSSFPEELREQWFGEALNGDSGTSEKDAPVESKIRVADAVLNAEVTERTHNLVNRHTGAVIKGGLFALEALPPKTSATLSISIASERECDEIIRQLANVLGRELLVGGNSNRGIGRMVLDSPLHCRMFDLSTIEGTADWMDAEYEERSNGAVLSGEKIVPKADENALHINVVFKIPRGEDLLVGDGQALDYTLQPQRVGDADGNERWRIPGSTLRGIIRGWMTRLAVREGKKQVRDSYEHWDQQFNEGGQTYKPDMIGWGFVEDKEERKKIGSHPDQLSDPILNLFGSMYRKGRIHIADSFSRTCKDADVQERMHVAIDRFSGGSNEGALFSNQVLTAQDLLFPVTIRITNPDPEEVGWLVMTLRAIHLGILSIGSSKSSGRLEIHSICANGNESEPVNAFAKEINQ